MRRLLPAAALALTTLLAPAVVAAPPGQAGGFNFRAGGFFPSGNSEFWDVNEVAFTQDKSDFNGFMGGVGYTAAITNYFEFDVNADFYGASARSADRAFTDQFGNPILHDARLAILPVTVGFRVLPAGRFGKRGTEGQRLVRRPVPYIGAGVGMAYWQYEEEGDFVASDLSIVYDRIKDTGLEFETHAQVGIEFPIAPDWNLSFEVRRSWAEATPSGGFAVVNPGKLDLGGVGVFFGASMRF